MLTENYFPTQRESTTGLENTPLITAVVEYNIAEVVRILSEYSDTERYINLTDYGPESGYHNTAVILAAMGKQTDMVRHLIEHGADVTIANNYGTTALHYACIFRDHDMINLLLEQGASLDAENNHGISPRDLYLYQFNQFPNEFTVLREVELMFEHLMDRWNFNQRPDAVVEYIEPLPDRVNQIPQRLKDDLITFLPRESLIFYKNNQAQFERGYLGFLYNGHADFLVDWQRIAKQDPEKTEHQIQAVLREEHRVILGKMFQQAVLTKPAAEVASDTAIDNNASPKQPSQVNDNGINKTLKQPKAKQNTREINANFILKLLSSVTMIAGISLLLYTTFGVAAALMTGQMVFTELMGSGLVGGVTLTLGSVGFFSAEKLKEPNQHQSALPLCQN